MPAVTSKPSTGRATKPPLAATAARSGATGKPSNPKPRTHMSKPSTSQRQDSKPSQAPSNSHPLGVSPKFLREFREKIKSKSYTTAEVCTEIVLKDSKSAPYVDSLAGKKDQVGSANIFVSHAWKYKFTDVCDTCIDFADENPKRTYFFYIDIFINNQHSTTTNPQSWWLDNFKKSVGKIGHTLLVLSPYNNPIPFTRAWCLWEILCTVQESATLTVRLPSSQISAFKSAITADCSSILTDLGNVQSQKAEASRPEDKRMILKLIEDTYSFHELDTLVKDKIREWLFKNAEVIVQESKGSSKETGQILVQLGSWYTETGKTKEALAAFTRSEAILSSPELADTCRNDLAALYNNRATLEQNQGNSKKALASCLKSLQLREALGEPDEATAILYNNIGLMYDRLGDFQKASEFYQKDVDLKEKLPDVSEERLATSYCNLAMFHLLRKNDADKAKQLCQKSIDLSKKHKGDAHYTVGSVYENMGIILTRLDEIPEAVEYFRMAAQIYRTNLGAQHPNLASLLGNLANALKCQGNLEEARSHYLVAEKITIFNFGEDHIWLEPIYSNLAGICAQEQDFESCLKYYEKCLKLNEGIEDERTRKEQRALVLNNMAVIHSQKRDYTKVLQMFEECLSLRTDLFGSDSAEVAEVKENIDFTNSLLQQ